MNPAVRKRLILVCLFMLGVGLAGSLLVFAIGSNIDFFYTPRDIVHGKDGVIPKVGQRIQLGGMVEPGSVERGSTEDGSLSISFNVFDKDAKIHVTHIGTLPDLFAEGQSVVVKGVIHENNVVVADNILAKHDENYTPPEVEKAMQENHESKPEQKQVSENAQTKGSNTP